MRKQAEYISGDIKPTPIQSDKALSFFALSLTLLLSTPESEPIAITENVRVVTENDIASDTLNGQSISLHKASIITKHTSR